MKAIKSKKPFKEPFSGYCIGFGYHWCMCLKGLVIVLALLLAISGQSQAATIDLADLLDSASPGDTITMDSANTYTLGEYSLSKSVTLLGNGATIEMNDGPFSAVNAVTLTIDQCSFIQGPGWPDPPPGAMIAARNGSTLIVSNGTTLTGPSASGSGAKVQGDVDYTPWLTEAPVESTVKTDLSLPSGGESPLWDSGLNVMLRLTANSGSTAITDGIVGVLRVNDTGNLDSVTPPSDLLSGQLYVVWVSTALRLNSSSGYIKFNLPSSVAWAGLLRREVDGSWTSVTATWDQSAHVLTYTPSNVHLLNGTFAISDPGCPDCSGDNVTLVDVTFPAGETCECVGTTSITIGTGVTIPATATVTFIAPSIKVQPGFHAATGAVVRMKQE